MSRKVHFDAVISVALAKGNYTCITRMHSSRMRTFRCSGRPFGRGVFAQGVGGVSAQGDVCLGGCLPRGSLPRGMSARHPAVDRMTDTCRNITLLQLCCGW